METETIDKLFLELSQVTTARTKTEIALFKALQRAANLLNTGTKASAGDYADFNRAFALFHEKR